MFFRQFLLGYYYYIIIIGYIILYCCRRNEKVRPTYGPLRGIDSWIDAVRAWIVYFYVQFQMVASVEWDNIMRFVCFFLFFYRRTKSITHHRNIIIGRKYLEPLPKRSQDVTHYKRHMALSRNNVGADAPVVIITIIMWCVVQIPNPKVRRLVAKEIVGSRSRSRRKYYDTYCWPHGVREETIFNGRVANRLKSIFLF